MIGGVDMYQNMRVPVISGNVITNLDLFTIAEMKNLKEVVAPVYIDSLTDDGKYGMLIEYGNYLYIGNKPESGYDIDISFETLDKVVRTVKQGQNYSIKIVCKTFLTAKSVTTGEAVLFTVSE